ncbi:hypothetical protein BN1723_013764 [Verticillium longisporum]|uniref:Uncharacterized protein n=1 Tax=Verticillium longisporum TaxID=100787 RepID=A0A0G4M1H3_VERLO|nr:hypothetical protein BN1723_013764 [Verticillium longisporum]CRK28119.1 hypothetical protein BN1708_004556 [Verticillium longisporum]
MSGLKKHGKNNRRNDEGEDEDRRRELEVSTSGGRRRGNTEINVGRRHESHDSSRHYSANSRQYQSNDRYVDSHDRNYDSNDRHYHHHVHHYGGQNSDPHPSDKIENSLDDIAQTRARNHKTYQKLEALNRESEEAMRHEARRQEKITSLLVKLQPSEAHCARQKDLIRRLKPQADEAAGFVWWPTNYERARCYEKIINEPAVVEEAGLPALPALPLAPAPVAGLLGDVNEQPVALTS